MKSLSPATTTRVLAALANAIDVATAQQTMAGVSVQRLDRIISRRGSKTPETVYAQREQAVAAMQTAEREARENRWALNEVRRALGLDVDRDAAEGAPA